MKKIVFLISVFFLVLMPCRADNAWRFDTLKLEKTVYKNDADTALGGMGLSFKFEYPVSVPKGNDLAKVQQMFGRIFSESEDFSGTPQQALDILVGDYTEEALDYRRELEEEGYEFNIGFENYAQSKELSIESVSKYQISLSTLFYTYLGGAHGLADFKYYNIDLRDGSLIKESDLFTVDYMPKLAKMIQDKVSETVDGDYLLVELSAISSNGNFKFTKDGIFYVYNQYEITPYVYGLVEVEIPYDEIKPIVNQKYIEMIDAIQSQSK